MIQHYYSGREWRTQEDSAKRSLSRPARAPPGHLVSLSLASRSLSPHCGPADSPSSPLSRAPQNKKAAETSSAAFSFEMAHSRGLGHYGRARLALFLRGLTSGAMPRIVRVMPRRDVHWTSRQGRAFASSPLECTLKTKAPKSLRDPGAFVS